MYAKTITTRADRDEAVRAVQAIRSEPRMHVQICEDAQLPKVARQAMQMFDADFVLVGDFQLPTDFPGLKWKTKR